MPDRRRLRIVLALIAAASLLAAVTLPVGTSTALAEARPDEQYLDALGIRYWLVVKTEPRPMRIHHLCVDLSNPKIEVVAAPAADPDGGGPSEPRGASGSPGGGPANATLTPPMRLADAWRAVALVNANSWQSLPDADGKRHTNWREGLPVEAAGLVVAGGKVRSPAHERFCAFWIDADGKAHVGHLADASQAREGVAGFLQLLAAGTNLRVPRPDEPIHPRTALGLDATGRRLTLVVVDGRQEGYSMGMTYPELGEYMKSLGCHDAVNLDGGGSSVMILSGADGSRRIVNDPSTKDKDGRSVARPIPVALVVRERK